ncbi:MAG: hypothetical protein ACPLZD_06440 [Candidatus Saccharicenans sp.]
MKLEFFNLNPWASDLNQSRQEIIKIQFIDRLFQRDFTLWKEKDEEISNRLGWLNSPLKIKPFLESYARQAEDFRASGIKLIVLLGMGGSSLAPEALSQLAGPRPGYPEFKVLDSTCPAMVKEVGRQTEKKPTLFIVSSKSGTTTETLSLFNYFYHQQVEIYGFEAGKNFVAITDPGTRLEKIATELNFRMIISGFPDVGGRFSALSPFGLFPAALIGYDLEKFLSPAIRSLSELQAGNYDHPGIKIGTTIGSLSHLSKNKLTLILPSSLKSLGRWLEQLIAESTGKEGKGIVPVIEIFPLDKDSYSPDRIFVYYDLEESEDFSYRSRIDHLLKLGQPLIHLTLSAEEIAEHLFVWEVATSVIGYFMKINPFNQPDVELTKIKTRELLAQSATPVSSVVKLHLDNDKFFQEFKSFLLKRETPAEYLSLLAFLPPDEKLEIALNNLARQITQKTTLPCTWNYGPAYLHSTGQLHKGGSDKGSFLGLISEEKEIVPIPDLPLSPSAAPSFNQLFISQALADFSILKEKGRKVLAIKLEENLIEKIFSLGELVRNL